MLLLNTAMQNVPDRKNNGTYPDVIEGQWYVKFIMHAVDKGMLDAEPTHGLIYPHRPVSRAEFLKMMTVAFRLPTNIPYQYTDIPPQAWYKPYIGIAYTNKLFRDPRQPLKLDPNALVTHKDASQAIQAILKNYPGLRTVSQSIMNKSLRKTPQAPSPTTTTKPVQQSAPPAQQPKRNLLKPQRTFVTSSMVKQAMIRLFQKNPFFSRSTEHELIDAINVERSKFQLTPLKENALLVNSATEHAKDMHARGYFSHFTPEGKSYVDRIRSAGYMDPDKNKCDCPPTFNLSQHSQYKTMKLDPNFLHAVEQTDCSCIPRFAVGENIAKGQLTVKQVMDDWMNSPPHRKNILRPEFEEIGIGVYSNVWVQNFGRLRYD